MMIYQKIQQELASLSSKEKAEHSKRFFKTAKGEYGENDQFIGVTVPEQRKIAKKYAKSITLSEIEILLQSPLHEERLTALFIMDYQFHKATSEEQSIIVELYLTNTRFINNWDLVDSSAYNILGKYLADKDRSLLYKLARSEDLWEQRISIIATMYFIRQNDFADTLAISKILLHHPHDLIQKAVGWMLREVGKMDFETQNQFMQENYREMPRTMLRYAIEKFPEETRLRYLHNLN